MSSRLFAALLILAAVAPAAAQSPAPAAMPAPLPVGVLKPFGQPSSPLTEAQKQERLERAALNSEIDALIQRTRTALVAVREQLAKTTDEAQRDALQRQAIQLKRDERVELYRVQLRFAEAAGRTAQAEQLRAVVQQLTAPPAARVAPAVKATRDGGPEAERANGAAR